MVKMIEIGMATPPVGLNIYVVAGIAPDLRVTDVFRGAAWFIPLDLATTALLFVFPVLVLWLPELMA